MVENMRMTTCTLLNYNSRPSSLACWCYLAWIKHEQEQEEEQEQEQVEDVKSVTVRHDTVSNGLAYGTMITSATRDQTQQYEFKCCRRYP